MELLKFQGHHGASPDCDVKGWQKVGKSWQHYNCTRPCAVAWASSGCVNGASRETSYPSREVASSCHSMGLKMFQDVSSKGPTVKTQSR